MNKSKIQCEFEVQGWYGDGYGWECVTTEETRAEAREQVGCYRENEVGTEFRVMKVRMNFHV